MRRIHKGQEPSSLRKIRETDGADWNGYGGKQEVRDLLCAEQGFLCAYCMCRIDPTEAKMKIEHWVARSKDPHKQFDWENILGVCLGGERKNGSKHERHCDTSKEDRTLHVHPAKQQPDPKTAFRFLGDGTIKSASDDTGIEEDIGCLNLNAYSLKTNRRQVIDSLMSTLGRGPWKVGSLRKELEIWNHPKNGKLREYAQVAVYHLERWIRTRLH